MASLNDFPPDVAAVASAAHKNFADSRIKDNLGVIIARAIMADRSKRISPVGLTFRQTETLDFIQAYMAAHHGVSPNFDELQKGLHLASKSGVARLLDELVRRGRITRVPHLARSITIVTRESANV